MSKFELTRGFSPDSRVWLFTGSKFINSDSQTAMSKRLNEFSQAWISHNNQLKSAAFVAHDIFVVLVVDESQAMASGCSIDTAMRFIQTLQIDYEMDFLDRNLSVYLNAEGKPQLTSIQNISSLIAEGAVSNETLFFDTMVSTLGDLENNWLKPLESFWLNKMVS